MEDLKDLDIPVNPQLQKDIAFFESLAQYALLKIMAQLQHHCKLSLTVTTQTDNTGTEAGVNALFTTAMPHALVLEKISLLLALNGMSVETQHIPGAANQQADMLSRWDGIATLPPQFPAINRVHFTLESLWQLKAQFHVYPPGSTISWLPPLTA